MKSRLTHRLSQSEIKELFAKTKGEHNDDLKEKLYLLTMNDDRRVAINALWCLLISQRLITSGFMLSTTNLSTAVCWSVMSRSYALFLVCFFVSRLMKIVSVQTL